MRSYWTVIGYAVALLTAPSHLIAQAIGIVEGQPIDSRAMTDSLNRPYWRALAATPCPRVRWAPDYSSLQQFQKSVAPIADRVRIATGASLPPLGFAIARRAVFRGSRYTIEKVTMGDRLRNAAHFGYLGRPVNSVGPSPLVVLLHGSGMHPREAFGVDVSAEYRPGERSEHAAFREIALQFLEAGYAVYVPWIADDQPSDRFPVFPWSLLQRNGASLTARLGNGGVYTLTVNQIAGALDYLETQPGIDASRIALVGWSEGADIAGMTAAVDVRIGAVARLEAPLDRAALRTTMDGVLKGSQFTHVDCALGDVEMAALVAPRALLYAYAADDESVARFAPFISVTAPARIGEIYAKLGVPEKFAVRGTATWNPERARGLRTWLDSALKVRPREVSSAPAVLRFQVAEPYKSPLIDSTNLGRGRYATTFGSCLQPGVKPSFESLESYLASVDPLRRSVAAALRVKPIAQRAPFKVLKRYDVAHGGGYRLEFVVIRSEKSTLPVMGLLATPENPLPERRPAVISFDANYGVGRPFGLPRREAQVYLNAYASTLVRNGSVVFAPYLPLDFPEVAAMELRARTGGQVTNYSLAVPMYSAAVDFVISLPQVDSTRVTAWGISYSATAALYTAALDPRITALVYSNPILSVDRLFQSEDATVLSPWWMELCSTLDAALTYLIAPRPFVRENGVRDANGYERSPLETVVALQNVYRSLGIERNLTLIRHAGGHETRASSAFGLH